MMKNDMKQNSTEKHYEWQGFNRGDWENGVDVREFIQKKLYSL